MSELRDKLVKLYPTIASSQLILDDAAIVYDEIAFHTVSQSNWRGILLYLRPRGAFEKFMETLITTYQDDLENLTFFKTILKEHRDRKTISSSPITDLPNRVDAEYFDCHLIFNNEIPYISRPRIKNRFRRMIRKEEIKHALIFQGKSCSGLTFVHEYVLEILTRLNIKYENLFEPIIFDTEPYQLEERPIKTFDLLKGISDELELEYTPEENEKETLSKISTFFNKLKNYSTVKNKKPIICLDEVYKYATPLANRLIGKLLERAIRNKEFYIVITIGEEEELKKDWSNMLKRLPTVKVDSFTKDDVITYIEKVFNSFAKELELEEDQPKELSEQWMQKNENKWSFDDDTLNVKAIGDFCYEWYLNLSESILNLDNE